MSAPPASYTLTSRFMVAGEGWREVDTTLGVVSFEAAGREASRLARELDAEHGGSHFWTVDLYNDRAREHGSYYQLFHGRLS